jgi:hypothetical protein
MVPERSVIYYQLTWLIARDDFISNITVILAKSVYPDRACYDIPGLLPSISGIAELNKICLLYSSS